MTLQLPGSIHVSPTADALYDELAFALLQAASVAVADRGVFHLALSGGSTPEPFYMRLVMDPQFRTIPWQATHLWVVDERRVPQDDPRSNWLMIRQTLADHVPTPRRQRHPMPVDGDDPAGAYEAELRRVIGGSPPRLDFVLLGMGDDAHTASLFPDSPALDAGDRLVALNDGPQVTPPPRITMTLPLINAARQVAVLVTGEKKASTLARVSDRMASGGDPASLFRAMPITGVQPTDGKLSWYLDAPAAGDA